MKPIPLFIVNFNRLAYVQQMLTTVTTNRRLRPIILDNASSYPPLLEWYNAVQDSVEIIRLEDNKGPRSFWFYRLHKEQDGFYAVTDPDLDLSKTPPDFVDVLIDGLHRYPEIIKCGLSLEINDLPDTTIAKKAKRHESRFWIRRRDERFWDAKIATTFAVYRGPSRPHNNYGPALRSDRPYTARHLPWYIVDGQGTPEDKYYWQAIRFPKFINWSTRHAKSWIGRQ